MRAHLLVGVLTFASASTAQAQLCQDGRQSVDGHCCWPGQRFDAEQNRCAGSPSCPTGLVASGIDCVPWSRGSGSQPPSSPEPYRWAESTQTDPGLLVAGSIVLPVGYFGAMMTALSLGLGREPSAYGYFSGREHAPFWWLGLIPIVHAAGAINAAPGRDVAIALAGLAGALLEIGGIVLLVLGADPPDERPDGGRGPVELRVIAGDGARLDLTARF